MRVWLYVAAVLAAGCADPATAPAPEDDFELDDLEATATTGVIRGVVVDAAIVPLEGATIKLQTTELTTTSNAGGQFGFDGLDPGQYFLTISKPGYDTVQQAATVEAGVERPPVLRVVLAADLTYNPTFDTIVHDGYYQCGTSIVVVCAAPNILFGSGTTDDTSTVTIDFGEDIYFIQTEMVWQSTQALSPALYFEMEALESGCDGDLFLTNARGESPIRTRANTTMLERTDIGGEDCGVYYSVFAGGAQGTPVGFSIEQRFTWYINAFYGYEPPEEWWFIQDGAYPPP